MNVIVMELMGKRNDSRQFFEVQYEKTWYNEHGRVGNVAILKSNLRFADRIIMGDTSVMTDWIETAQGHFWEGDKVSLLDILSSSYSSFACSLNMCSTHQKSDRKC